MTIQGVPAVITRTQWDARPRSTDGSGFIAKKQFGEWLESVGLDTSRLHQVGYDNDVLTVVMYAEGDSRDVSEHQIPIVNG